MNLLSTMLLFWTGLCAASVLAAVVIVIAEMRSPYPDFGDSGEVTVGLHR